ncbi:MAG TPA: hypothetical protein VFP84_31340 [Kofleriaceae bacterium]|nr:hypothetical protein [Kofleriaceae bacterium]
MLTLVVIATGCPGGSGEIGAACGNNGDCSSALQCLANRCQPRCTHAPDCGDGYACDQDGLCHQAVGHDGDRCVSETECAAGFSCRPADNADETSHLVGNCIKDHSAALAGARCASNNECRNGTCALGRCVDLCLVDSDCASGEKCWDLPSVTVSNAMLHGCLPEHGAVSFDVPVDPVLHQAVIPAPKGAASVSLVMTVDDPSLTVGATRIAAPDGTRIYNRPCASALQKCLPTEENDEYFGNPQRHTPALGQSVLSIPSGTTLPVNTGLYTVDVAAQMPDGSPSLAPVHATAVVRLDEGTALDLHFFFLDLADHPCQDTIGPQKLNASTAPYMATFQDHFLSDLSAAFTRVQISVNAASYEDVLDHPSLDGLDLSRVGDLLKLGKYATGINVFFVRSLSPAGVQAYSPNPGPAGLAGTPGSGIVIGLDTLCYRSWQEVSHLAAHEIARYMGLYHNAEIGYGPVDQPIHPTWRDQIMTDNDIGTDPAANLMFYAEPLSSGQVPKITDGQRSILVRSAVLRSGGQ